MIIHILQSIGSVAQKIYTQVQLAKANQAQCQLLRTRIDIVMQAIKGLENIKDADRYSPGLLALEKCLHDALKLIQSFAKDTGWFKKIISCNASNAKTRLQTPSCRKGMIFLTIFFLPNRRIPCQQI